MLNNEHIKSTVEQAFAPLRCVAEIWDYDAKLRFKVFDENDNGIVEMPEVILGNVREENALRDLLMQVRERITEKGFSLDAWP